MKTIKKSIFRECHIPSFAKKNLPRVSILSCSLFLLSGCMLSYIFPYYMGAYQGRVVDINTSAPIEGAVVIAVYKSMSNSPAGALSQEIDAQETLTDANGEFYLPEISVHGSRYAGHPWGKLKIFKPGYGTNIHPKSSRLCMENGNWVECPMQYDKYMLYKLPKLNTTQERKNNLPHSSSFIPPEKQFLFLQAIDNERINLGLQPLNLLEEKVKQSAEH